MDKYLLVFNPQPPSHFSCRSSTGGAPTMSEDDDPNGGEVIIDVPENKVRTD